jgi:hypothetical protein
MANPWRILIVLAVIALAASIHPVLAQVSARQATPADAKQFQSPTDIPSPMLLEVKLSSWVTKVSSNRAPSVRVVLDVKE